MSEWNDLENQIKNLFVDDNSITIPGSGNGKGEEDVVGLSTIIQCKYSNKKNISILSKDIDRLITASELQDKLPIFVTKNNDTLLISIPENYNLKDIIKKIILTAQIEKVLCDLDKVSTINEYNKITEFLKKIIKFHNEINEVTQSNINKIKRLLDIKFDKITMNDLFEDKSE